MTTIDISGPNGNAFYLLGTARKLTRQLDMNFEEIHAEMTSGDYDQLLAAFKKHFGRYVKLVNTSYEEDESDWGEDEYGAI